MLLYYIRHGDPIYDPDSLTPLGHRQAEAVAKRLAVYGLDRIYCSTSNRARLTAQPTCELLKMDMELLDYANESHAARDLMVDTPRGRHWLFQLPEVKRLLLSPEVRALGDRWFDHPEFAGRPFEQGLERIRRGTDGLLASLGYEHIPGTGMYRAVAPTRERVALFAHQGFGMAFMSCLLDIPYSQYCVHFDMTHSGMTAIEFREQDGIAIPMVCTLSSDAHLYKEGLPTRYNNRLCI